MIQYHLENSDSLISLLNEWKFHQFKGRRQWRHEISSTVVKGSTDEKPSNKSICLVFS